MGASPNELPFSLQEITELPDYNKISFKEQSPHALEECCPDALSPQALDLLGEVPLFSLYPPQQRISASQVGRHHCPDPPCSCPL